MPWCRRRLAMATCFRFCSSCHNLCICQALSQATSQVGTLLLSAETFPTCRFVASYKGIKSVKRASWWRTLPKSTCLLRMWWTTSRCQIGGEGPNASHLRTL
eukprot:1090334-Amphidinium_carterae.1